MPRKKIGENLLPFVLPYKMVTMRNMKKEIIDWLTVHLLPFEADLRAKLRRVCNDKAEVDDVVQEVYCKIMEMESVAHILDPHGFLVRMAKNIVTDRLRRDAVVRFEAMANLEELSVPTNDPSVERIVLARTELKWVLSLVASLPVRCREVFRARRIYGLSQKEAAQSLGITEKAVEYETSKGMELISDMIGSADPRDPATQLTMNRTANRAKKAGEPHVND